MARCCAQIAQPRRASLNFALLVAAYMVYLLIGASIFSAIELPYEQELRQELLAARRDFLSNNTCVSDARLDELLARALQANNYGVSVLRNDNSDNWDFVSSLFFSSTVLTTTGYGHTVPLSDGGKAFCIFYALFGIPVTLFFLTVTVHRIMVPVTRRPISYLHRRWAMSKSKLAAIHATCLAIVTAFLFILFPALIFMSLESDWDFLESLYFCFMSLTTIGLGDYVPGQTHTQDNPHPQLYRLAITLYLLLGLVCVLLVLETCCELPQMKRLARSFNHENVRELDSETANIIDLDHTGGRLCDQSDPVGVHHLPAIASVLEQAATLRQDKSAPYTPLPRSSVNGDLR